MLPQVHDVLEGKCNARIGKSAYSSRASSVIVEEFLRIEDRPEQIFVALAFRGL